MKTIYLQLLTLSILLIANISIKAQNVDSLAKEQTTSVIDQSAEVISEVVLKDGNILRGKILVEYQDSILFNSDLTGTITLQRVSILYIKKFNPDSKSAKLVYANLASRYFFSPSAINMKKGDGYYQNTFFTLSTFNYAVNDYFTIGGGFELVSLLVGYPIVIITPKVSFPVSEKLHVGGGYLYANILGTESSFAGINMAYGNVTYGSSQSNITLNVGTSLTYGGRPVFTVCGFHQLTPKFGLMSESWIIPSFENNYANMNIVGARFIGRKNLFDFGLITLGDLGNQSLIPIPFLSYSLKF